MNTYKMLLLFMPLLFLSFTACEPSDSADQADPTAADRAAHTPAANQERPVAGQQAGLPPEAVELTDPQLENARWILIELQERKIERVRDPRKTNYVQFHGDGQRVHAYAGCNHMSGTYEISEDQRLSFSPLIATRMACEDMENEHQLAAILETTESYAIRDGILSLNVPGMEGAAKFERE